MIKQRLIDRHPALGAEELVARFRPPRRFAAVRFGGYIPNSSHPSQKVALDEMNAFATDTCRSLGQQDSSGWFRKRFSKGVVAQVEQSYGRYIDGGYGVGKTHLLASLWHEVNERGFPAAYLSFSELTAAVGFLGMQEAVRVFSSFRLVCIDEFELDDVANTLMAVTLLRGITSKGVRIATTSNSLPERLGEGRFSAEDFKREISAIASHFETIRIDGPDYRRGQGSSTDLLSEEKLDAFISAYDSSTSDALSLDNFDELLAHLRQVHPVQFSPMLDGLSAVFIKALHPIANQGDALLFVQLVDELYEAEITVLASGCSLSELFPDSYRHGGYRKKYGRCESRLSALLAEAGSA